jgi:cyclohexanecarboxylate-CoA ligase
MSFDPIIPPQRLQAMREQGLWPERLLTDYLDDAARERPEQVAVTDFNSMTGRFTTLSYRQLQRLSTRMALGLAELGVGPGDVVSIQLPNWWQFPALYLACIRLGAALNPLMPIFRQRELRYMLGFAQSKVLVVPREFRGFDHAALAAELRGDLPALQHVLVVDGAGPEAFEPALLQRRWEDGRDVKAFLRERKPGPNDVSVLVYTSGTTGEPKGVMHTSNTVLSCVVHVVAQLGVTPRDVTFMASPLAHMTGFLYGMMMPIVLGTKAVLLDIWNPGVAAQRIQDERATWTMGATPFVADFAQHPDVERYDVSTLRMFTTAGAPIPRVLVQATMEKFPGLRVVSGWGMSENGLVSTTLPTDPQEKVFGTDGVPVRGMELRIVDEDGAPCPPDTEGRLQARGAANFVGYLKRPDAFDTDGEGWFETGDNARIDPDGYVRITGRSKDIIIRGGENVPVVEVENLLYRHPAVQDAALVAMPDARLGERGCAFVTLRAGQSLTLGEVVRYLQQAGLARQYFPERLEVLGEMPRTPSGKIQKFKLREAARELRPESVRA